MHDVYVNVVNFQQTSSSPDSQTIVDPDGPGQVPTAIIVVYSGLRAPTATDQILAEARISIGAYDGTTHRSLGVMAENGTSTATANAAYRVDTATIIQLPSQNGPALEVEAAVTAVGVDQFTLMFEQPAQFYGFAIFVYGSVTAADVQSIASSASIGGTVDASMPILPDLVLCFTNGQAFVADGSGDGMSLSVGAAARWSATQGCVATCAEDRAATQTSVGNITRNDCAGTLISSSGGTVTEGTRLDLSFPSATGFRITTRNAAVAMEALYVSLYLGGRKCWVGTPTVASSSIGNKAVTGVGFKPMAVLAACQQIGIMNTILASQGNLSIGCATSLSTGQAAIRMRDNQANSETQSTQSPTQLVKVISAAAAYDWIAGLVSMDPDGFTLNVSDASGTDRMPLLVAIEDLITLDPGVIELGLELPAPALALTLHPGVIDLGLELPAPALALTLTPGVIELGLELPAPTLVSGVTLTPGVIELGLELPAPALALTLHPGTIELGLELPAPMLGAALELVLGLEVAREVLFGLESPRAATVNVALARSVELSVRTE